MRTIIQHRIAHELYRLEIPLIPWIVSEHAHGTAGIDIHPGASIGERFFIDHGTGVVIGETCEIGRNVRIYQGATLGAKSFPLDRHGQPVKGIPRHPIVEDGVIIYSPFTATSPLPGPGGERDDQVAHRRRAPVRHTAPAATAAAPRGGALPARA